MDAPAGPLQIDLIKDMGAHLFLWYYKAQREHQQERTQEKRREEKRREEKRREEKPHVIKSRVQGN